MRPIEPGVGYTVRRFGDRASLVIDEQEVAPSVHPFKVSVVKVGSDWAFKVRPGTVNSRMPTLGGTALDAATAPTGSISATGIVYLAVNHTDGMNFPVSVTVHMAATLPATTNTVSYVSLASIDFSGSAPKVTSQNVETSLWGERLKCGTSDAEYFYTRA